MTTIAEKQAPVATLIDDLASSLAGLSDWEDGDTNVTNDQSTDGWRDNARVFTHIPSGRYLLFYVSHDDGFLDYKSNTKVSGIRFVYSDDWDSTNSHPQGNTNSTDKDPFRSESTWSGDRRGVAFNTENFNYGGIGAWLFSTSMGNSRTDFASNYTINYFLSARNDGVSVGSWSTRQDYGLGCYFSYEHTSGKFWSDGIENFTVMNKFNSYGMSHGATSYGFQYTSGYVSDDYSGHPVDTDGLEESRWGFINSTSTDDTYFVQYGLLYSEANRENPSVYTEDILSNDRDQGGAHGDEVSYDGNTYKILKQSGGSQNDPITACIRFE